MNYPAVGNHLGSLVRIPRLGRAVVPAHHAQGGHRANAICAVGRDHFEEEPGRGVHVLSGVNWLQRICIVVRNCVPVNEILLFR